MWTNHSVPFPRCTTPRHGAEKEECRDCCMALVTPYIRTHFETGEEVIWREVIISHRKKRPLAQKFMCFKESIGQEEHKQAKLPNMRCVCYDWSEPLLGKPSLFIWTATRMFISSCSFPNFRRVVVLMKTVRGAHFVVNNSKLHISGKTWFVMKVLRLRALSLALAVLPNSQEAKKLKKKLTIKVRKYLDSFKL